MKKIATALALAAASLLSSNAMAQGYVSGSVGFTNIDTKNVCVGCDDSDFGVKLLGGYAFNGGFAAEGGYISFGKSKVAGGSVKVDGFLIGGAYHHAFNPSWGITGRVGAAVLKTRITGWNSDTHTQPYIGVAGTYTLDKNIKLEVGLDITRAEHEGDKIPVQALTAGVRFGF